MQINDREKAIRLSESYGVPLVEGNTDHETYLLTLQKILEKVVVH